MSLKKNNLLIIILIILNIIVFSCDFYFYFLKKPQTPTINEPKKPKENIYITTDFFTDIKPQVLGIGYYQQTIGSLIFYKSSYNDNLIRIIIGEQDELTDLTYKSILSTINFIDSDNYEEFLNTYQSLQNITFNRFKITVNAPLDEIEKRYLQSYSDYQFVLIEISRGITETN